MYVTAVDANGNEITNTVSATAVTLKSTGALSTETLTLIAALIIVIVVASVIGVLLVRRRNVGKGPETKATEAEKPETPEKKE